MTTFHLTCLVAAFVAGIMRPVAADVPPNPPPPDIDIVEVADAIRKIAAGEASSVSSLLADIAALPAVRADAPQTVILPGFTDADGHRVRAIEIRVRQGGIEHAPLIMVHIVAEPCVDLHALARRMGADQEVRYVPSPHAASGAASAGARGFATNYPGGSRFEITGPQGAPGCATLITAQRPAYVTTD